VKKKQPSTALKRMALYDRIRQILESARSSVSRSVNTTQVVANWLIGREIVEDEQKGRRRAEYGKQLLLDLSIRLTADYRKGYSVDNLELFRRFFLEYNDLLGSEKSDALRRISSKTDISEAVRRKSKDNIAVQLPQKNYVEHRKSWQPGQLHPSLSWTHYRALLRVDQPFARPFYEIEAVKNNWSARETERQINSLLFERLAKSKDKAGLMRLARKGQEIQRPEDVFKDPVVMEFLGLPESPRLVESTLETALINNLQTFLLELGKGFAFVARQQRLTLDGDHFYVDLVFYHTILKCHVLIDLKVGKLNHQDLGQLQFYVNYYDRERRTAGDNPTLGLILCTDKNDAVVHYTLGEEQKKQIFSSRYKLHLPTEEELRAEIRRELKTLGAAGVVKIIPKSKRRRE
jgi:predicted nuclease of restriction endonuclease-like (RecB) superfamily